MLSRFILVLATLFILSCGNKGKESAASIAQEWCNLNAKVHKAESDMAKETAKEARKKFEDNMNEKYKDRQDFLKEIGNEVEKCEAASEGR